MEGNSKPQLKYRGRVGHTAPKGDQRHRLQGRGVLVRPNGAVGGRECAPHHRRECPSFRIIAIVNISAGGGLDTDVALVTGLQIKESLLKDDTLKASAKANSEEDFAIACYDSGEDVLYDGL